MRKILLSVPLLMFVLLSASVVRSQHMRAEDSYLSPVALVRHGDTLFVAQHTANRIAIFDTAHKQVVQQLVLPGPPNGLALSPGGDTLYVAGGMDAGYVQLWDLSAAQVTATLSIGHTPSAPVVNRDGQYLFLCNRFNNSVSVLDLSTHEVVAEIAVSREPVAAAITPDDKFLLVANLLPAGPADAKYVGAVVEVIDAREHVPLAQIGLPNGSTSVQDVCISPDGQFAYVTHILSRYQLPTTQLERGWINTNALSVIDVPRQALVNTVLLDNVNLGAANPWGVVCTPDGQWLCVAHAGSHEISVIDRAKLHERLDKAVVDGVQHTVPNDLAFMVGLRKRYKLQGKGPRGIVASNSTVFAAEYFSGSVAELPLKQQEPVATSHPLGDEPEFTLVRAGEAFFHDAEHCFQQWQSCASCHPGEARVDALNWDNLNDGIGNPKNTKSMLLAHATPPAMVTGVRADAETAVRAGIRFILFNQLPEEHAVSVDEYLKSLRPVPSPELEQGSLSAAARRGQQLFERAECSRCHSGDYLTDMKLHRVGTSTALEPERPFDTPTLIEVWRTAPYLHDGRAATIEEVLEKFNPDDLHGKTSDLSAQEIADLAVYVRSL